MKVYVVTGEPYHGNSSIIAVCESLEDAKELSIPFSKNEWKQEGGDIWLVHQSESDWSEKWYCLKIQETIIGKGETMKVYIGIDPGAEGGIASIILSEDKVRRVNYLSFAKASRPEVWSWIKKLKYTYSSIDSEFKALIEKVHAFPGQGVTSMFTFGENYGVVQAYMIAAEIPFELVKPKDWQKEYGLSKSKKESKPEYKLRIMERAQEVFPHLEIWKQQRSKGKQLSVCDAILIAEYTRRKFEGVLV